MELSIVNLTSILTYDGGNHVYHNLSTPQVLSLKHVCKELFRYIVGKEIDLKVARRDLKREAVARISTTITTLSDIEEICFLLDTFPVHRALPNFPKTLIARVNDISKAQAPSSIHVLFYATIFRHHPQSRKFIFDLAAKTPDTEVSVRLFKEIIDFCTQLKSDTAFWLIEKILLLTEKNQHLPVMTLFSRHTYYRASCRITIIFAALKALAIFSKVRPLNFQHFQSALLHTLKSIEQITPGEFVQYQIGMESLNRRAGEPLDIFGTKHPIGAWKFRSLIKQTIEAGIALPEEMRPPVVKSLVELAGRDLTVGILSELLSFMPALNLEVARRLFLSACHAGKGSRTQFVFTLITLATEENKSVVIGQALGVFQLVFLGQDTRSHLDDRDAKDLLFQFMVKVFLFSMGSALEKDSIFLPLEQLFRENLVPLRDEVFFNDYFKSLIFFNKACRLQPLVDVSEHKKRAKRCVQQGITFLVTLEKDEDADAKLITLGFETLVLYGSLEDFKEGLSVLSVLENWDTQNIVELSKILENLITTVLPKENYRRFLDAIFQLIKSPHLKIACLLAIRRTFPDEDQSTREGLEEVLNDEEHLTDLELINSQKKAMDYLFYILLGIIQFNKSKGMSLLRKIIYEMSSLDDVLDLDDEGLGRLMSLFGKGGTLFSYEERDELIHALVQANDGEISDDRCREIREAGLEVSSGSVSERLKQSLPSTNENLVAYSDVFDDFFDQDPEEVLKIFNDFTASSTSPIPDFFLFPLRTIRKLTDRSHLFWEDPLKVLRIYKQVIRNSKRTFHQLAYLATAFSAYKDQQGLIAG